VTALTDPSRPRHWFRWWIAFLLFLATSLGFYDRQAHSVIAPLMMKELRLAGTDYFQIVFAFILSFTVMFTLGGRLLERLGTRRRLLVFVHGFWITNYLTTIGDPFAGRTVGSLAGVSGTDGGIGGFLNSLLTGVAAERVRCNPLFVPAGVMYPIGLLIILITVREVRPIAVSLAPAVAR
jgi:MFS family permease